MAEIELDRVRKVFAGGVAAVDDVSLRIEDGEFIALVGPSGCGKSTLLRSIAGLEEISTGEIRIGGRDVTDLAPRHRDVAMVFQSYALYPHMSVRQNLGYGLKVRRMPKRDIAQRVEEVAAMLGLTELLERRPAQLSGGQRQRVAMGRAIVRQPQAFLMDEPLSNLDAKLRVQMRAEIARLQNDLGVTTIYVTHDQVEAMTMGDRVAVMRKGELQQVAPPQELYDRPLNLFVGGFIGSPAMNVIEATLERADGGLAANIGSQRIALGDETLSSRPALKRFEGRRVILGIRPEDLDDATLESDLPAGRRLTGEVQLTEALGSEIMVHVAITGTKAAETEETKELARDVGAEGLGDVAIGEEKGAIFVGRFGARSRVRQGDSTEIAVDTRALHFFDPDTGLGIYDDSGTTKGAGE